MSEPEPVVDTTLIQAMVEALTPAQYGTSMHWPYCRSRNCTGCLPPLPPMPPAKPQFDLSLFRRPGADRE